MNDSNNEYDCYENYNGFEKISKAKNHVITIKTPYKIGVCDLNSNCSNIELDIEQIRNERQQQQAQQQQLVNANAEAQALKTANEAGL